MTRPVRLVVFGLGSVGLTLLFALAIAGMPPFGAAHHPYRDLAVPAALEHVTANVVSSVNFDQRALDTLGEETILLGSVIGVAALLRPSKEEIQRPLRRGGRVLDVTTFISYLVLPLTLLIGLDVVVHGHLTPGGGFQGGLVLATGLHLLYLAGRFESLERLRPLTYYQWGEAVSTVLFAGLGLAGIVLSGEFLANIVPLGSFQDLLSAGTVPVLNIAVGGAVGGGAVVLLAQFLAQAMRIEERPDRESTS